MHFNQFNFILKDIAAAVFMATATAMPELFVNVIALFMTDSDMGIGTVIGSLMFNTLGVSAIACFAVIKVSNLSTIYNR